MYSAGYRYFLLCCTEVLLAVYLPDVLCCIEVLLAMLHGDVRERVGLHEIFRLQIRRVLGDRVTPTAVRLVDFHLQRKILLCGFCS